MINREDFAIVIGISHYPSLINLAAPVDDARKFVAWLNDPKGGGLPSENVQLLVSEEQRIGPTRDVVERAFSDIRGLSARDGERVGRRLYIYMAGHGYGTGSDEVVLLLGDSSQKSLNTLPTRAYADYFRQSGKFDEVVLFVDCGRTVNPSVVTPPTAAPWPIPIGSQSSTRESSFLYAFATAPGGQAYETPSTGSLFTDALLRGLRGGAAGPDGVVSSQSLQTYLSQHVSKTDRFTQVPSVILGGALIIFCTVPRPELEVNNAQEAKTEAPTPPVAQEAKADGASLPVENESIDISSISDAPAEKDTLGFEPYVKAISRFLLSADTKPPLTLSIEGEWGSGKSSFLLQLRRAVVGQPFWRRLKSAWSENSGLTRHTRISRIFAKAATLGRAIHEGPQFFVQFNPWRHDKEDALWAAFALEFMRQLSMQRFFLRRWWGELRLFLGHYKWKRGWFEALRAVFLWTLVLVLLIGVPTEILRKKPRWAEQVLIALSEREDVSQREKIQEQNSSALSVGKKPIRTEPDSNLAPTHNSGKNTPLLVDTSGGEKPNKEDEKPDIDPVLKALLLIGGNAAYFAVVLTIWLKAKDLIGNPFQVDLKKYLSTPDYEGRVAFVEQFHNDFKKIVDAYAGSEKVFVFIDDLDRCEIPKAADLVKAVNLLISDDPRLIFVLGMDREKVAAGLAVKYEKVLPYLAPNKPDGANAAQWRQRSGLEYGQAFLEKFIQLPFRIPDPNLDNYAEFISTISTPIKGPIAPPQDAKHSDHSAEQSEAPFTVEAGLPRPPQPIDSGSPATEAAVRSDAVSAERRRLRELQFQGDSDEVRSVALMIAKTLGPNPRRLKQFINLFRLQAYIVNEVGLFDPGGTQLPVSFPQLGKFVGISLKWPALLEDWRSEPNLLVGLQELALAKSPSRDGASPAAAKWAKEKKLMLLLSYGTPGQNGAFNVDNPRLYQLLHVCPPRARDSRIAVQAS